jgi:hypothetical protein
MTMNTAHIVRLALLSALALLLCQQPGRSQENPERGIFDWIEDDVPQGRVKYTWPEAEFEDYYQWELPAFSAWEQKRQELFNLADGDLLTREQLGEIKPLEEALKAEGRALREQDKKDGYAIASRRAWLRFKQRNSDSNKYADCSPAMLGREGERFDDVWTYSYSRPFVVYFEKTAGQDFKKVVSELNTIIDLLRQEEVWFRRNFIEPFALKRVLPIDGPTQAQSGPLAGKKFATPGELAEAEGWPLEIIMVKNSETFQSLLGEMGAAIPGVRAFYRAPLQRMLCWHDATPAENEEQEWFRQSALIHECFHMLSDHYAAKPLPWTYRKVRNARGLRAKEWIPSEERARFCNLLVSEGLADAAAGFSNEGDGAQVRYTFGQMNRLRVKDLQSAYKQLGNQNLFRIRDLLDCVHYGHVSPTGHRCWERTGMKQKMNGFPRDASIYIGIYYATASTAVSFFNEFTENGAFKYRDKWLAYVKAAYTGSIEMTDFSPEPGRKAFKEALGISSDEDFDKLETEFVQWAQNLKLPE